MDLSRRPVQPNPGLPTTALLLCLLAPLVLLGACGERAPATRDAAPKGPTSRRTLTADGGPAATAAATAGVDDAAKAAFALERLLTGPLPRTSAFPIPQLHAQNLLHAQADLIALAPETIRLLSDPALVRRLTAAPAGSQNAWHGILDVLQHIEDKPAAVVHAWTRPALETTDVPLVRRAVSLLATIEDEEARGLLLEFLARRPRDREVATHAGRALIAAGSPWREQALRIFYRDGAAPGWSAVARWLQAADGGTDALVAWALLAETSAPRPFLDTRRTNHPTWYPARLLLDGNVWPDDPTSLEVSLEAGRVFAPPLVKDGGGYVPEGRGSAGLVPTPSLEIEGKFHAADARCRLAAAGVASARAAVLADRAGKDPDLAEVARACPLETPTGDATRQAQDILAQFFGALEAGYAAGTDGIGSALAVLLETDEPAARDALYRILDEARPRVTYASLLEIAQDLLIRLDPEGVRTWVLEHLAEQEDAAEMALALRLVRRRPSMAYVAALLEAESAAEPRIRNDLRKLLVWVHAAAPDADAGARGTFVGRVTEWILPLSDSALGGLLPGLLDLGPEGARAYAEGLRGNRRSLYVDALAGRAGLMPLEVAQALLEGLDAATSATERRRVLIAAYAGAPAAAAPALAAARSRLEPAVRAEADDVLESIRHRAAR